MDPSNENPCLDISNHPDNPRRFVINAPDFSRSTTSAVEKPCRDPHFRKNPSSQVNLVQDDFRSVPTPKGKKSVSPLTYQRKRYQVRNLSRLSSKNDLRNGCVSSLPSSLGQVNEARMQNSIDLILQKCGSSSKSCKSAKQTIYDMPKEIIVINKEEIAEATIALNVGFPSDRLIDEEKKYGVVSKEDGVEQINYLLIRNHIIRKWRENVLKWVTKEMFLDIVPKHFGPLVDNAYGFLVSHGYINFGVAPAIKDRILVEPRQQNVIVVGAGLAGLGAARQLRSFGFKVTVLEGKSRAGGRVYTKNWYKNVAVDLGGSVLTGVNGNPLQILVRQLSLKLHKVRAKCPLYGVDGTPMDRNLDERVERSFNELLSTLSEVRKSMGEASEYVSLGAALRTHQEPLNEEETKYFNWHLANLEFCNASLLEMLSLALWDQDDLYEMDGAHCFLHGGNGKLVEALAENLNIHYGKIVEAIQYGSDGVRVTVGGGQIYKGDMALCTVPLGVLKSRTISFTPKLPQRKLDAIRRLGFGLLNKVVLLFPHAFWRRDLDSFGHLSEHPSQRGEFFLFYSYANVAGGPVLIALVAGEAAYRFESEDPTVSVNKVLRLLKGIYEPQGIQVPKPINTHCTRWGSDPLTRGSYSNVAVGASGDDYDILAENVGNGRLFFAGEATCKRYPASMHGALLSGFREAGYMSRCASNRASGSTVEKKLPEKWAEARTSVLSDLFKRPDEEFGRFALLFGKKSAESMAILRMTRDRNEPGHQYPDDDLLFQQLQSDANQQQVFHIYRLISRQHAIELKEVREGDAAQVKYLIDNPEVKLLGREGVLGRSADSVIATIKAARRQAASKRKAPPPESG